MSSCEKCWVDSGGAPFYRDLVEDRNRNGRVCTPEEQAGPDAGECPVCKRKTLHQHTGEPMCHCAEAQIAWANQRASQRTGGSRD